MGIVTSEDTRAGARDIYLPASERGMAHRSYPSPDGKSSLVVEMERAPGFPAAWCRSTGAARHAGGSSRR